MIWFGGRRTRQHRSILLSRNQIKALTGPLTLLLYGMAWVGHIKDLCYSSFPFHFLKCLIGADVPALCFGAISRCEQVWRLQDIAGCAQLNDTECSGRCCCSVLFARAYALFGGVQVPKHCPRSQKGILFLGRS